MSRDLTSNRRHIRRLVRRRGLLENPSNLFLHRALGRNLAVLLEKQIRQSPGIQDDSPVAMVVWKRICGFLARSIGG